MRGFCSTDGTVVIDPCFNWAQPFSEGFAAVRIGSLWGFIDRRGDIRIDPGYDLVLPFREGIAVAVKEGQFGAIDRNNHVVIDYIYEKIGTPINGLCEFRTNGKDGLMTTRGDVVVAPTYNKLENSSCEFATIKKKEGYYYIDRAGSERFGPFKMARAFFEGVAVVKLHNGRTALLDSDGALREVDWHLSRKSEGKIGFAVQPNLSKWGFVDHDLKTVIEPTFDKIISFHEGHAVAAVGGMWGLIDHSGDWRVDPEFSQLTILKDGISIGQTGAHSYIVSISGGRVEPPSNLQFCAGTVSEGLCVVSTIES